MALPSTINAASPAGSESPSLGDDQFRALKDAVESILGIPDNTAVSVAYLVGAATGLTAVALRNAGGNPATAGYLQRNAAALLFHDGTAARTLVDTATAQALAGKTLTALVGATFADQAADADAAGELQLNGRRLSFFDGGQAVRLGGVVHVNTTPVGNIGAGEDTLMSYTLPANTFNANGRTVRVYAWGFFAGTVNAKTLKFKLGAAGTATLNTTAAPNNSYWHAQILITRTGSNAQVILVDYADIVGGTSAGNVSYVAATETDSGTLAITFTGESAGAATDDVIQQYMLVEVLN